MKIFLELISSAAPATTPCITPGALAPLGKGCEDRRAAKLHRLMRPCQHFGIEVSILCFEAVQFLEDNHRQVVVTNGWDVMIL